MHSIQGNVNFFGIAGRIAALASFLTTPLAHPTLAQAPASIPATAALISPSEAFFAANPASPAAGTSSSSEDNVLLDIDPDPSASQPPPRRYGRPNFSDKTSNPDGSSKYVFLAAIGVPLPVGNTHKYETPGYGFQIGGGRNFNKNFGVILQFDYDHFGLQAATLANQNYIYDYGCPAGAVAAGTCGVSGLDGNNHVWSFTLNPTYTFASQRSLGAYLVAGAGFYHKVTNFTEPMTAEQCSLYGCGYYNVDQTVDHYTSNAFGANGGFGLTCKISHFSSAAVYLDARYVLILNPQRAGYTAQNVATTPYTGYDAYPANSNRTTYVPIKLGFRF